MKIIRTHKDKQKKFLSENSELKILDLGCSFTNYWKEANHFADIDDFGESFNKNNLKYTKKVKFDDGKVQQVPAKIAQKALDKFDGIRMNNAKYKFMRSLSKSPQSLMKAVNASYTIPPMDVNPGGPSAMDRYRMSYLIFYF